MVLDSTFIVINQSGLDCSDLSDFNEGEIKPPISYSLVYVGQILDIFNSNFDHEQDDDL